MPDSGAPLLQVEALSVRFGTFHALENVGVSVHSGEIVVLLGANGAGKSTLFRTVSGLCPAAAGTIRFDGEDVTRWPSHRLVAAGIAQAPEGKHLFPESSVRKNLMLGGYVRRKEPDRVRASIEEVFELFPVLREKARDAAGTLSGGQQQMLAIGRALMARPRLLLLDEPSLGLAPLVVDEVFRAILEINARGTSILLAEQNAHAALRIAERGYVIEEGAVALEGDRASLMGNPEVRRAYIGVQHTSPERARRGVQDAEPERTHSWRVVRHGARPTARPGGTALCGTAVSARPSNPVQRSVRMKSREVHLAHRPEGTPQPDDFEVVETDLRDPDEGELLVRNAFMSVDPYMRGRMRDRQSYVEPFDLGEVMTGGAVGRVVASRHPDFDEGDWVLSDKGWREAFLSDGGSLGRLGALEAPPSAYLGVLGMPGMTAYVGLVGVLELEEGETIFVSGAAGAVGSTVGQIAKVKGCRVIGSAGSEEKVRFLTEELGFDHAFDYNHGRLKDHIRDGAPDGLDLYFDNVGGDHLEAAIGQMRQFGRIALCGAISMYNDETAPPGPSNLPRAIGMGLTLKGFLVRHFGHLRDRFRRDMTGWLDSGAVTYRETVVDGIESAPKAFIGLFEGANIGKMVVRLDPEA